MKKTLLIKDLENISDNHDDLIFLTFDIDWASDEVISYCLNILEEYNLKATFFVTHDTPVLERMKENPNIELGIHPNFNFLLNGDFRYGKTYIEVIDYYLRIVPEAVSVRSHSLVQSSQILDLFHERNIKFDVNLLIPRNSNIELKPIKFWKKNLTRIPYFWEDDTHILYEDNSDVNYYLDFKGLKVFDFHPIHVFLNTESLLRYNNARPHFQCYNDLKEYVNKDSPGTKTFFFKLIDKISS